MFVYAMFVYEDTLERKLYRGGGARKITKISVSPPVARGVRALETEVQ